MKPLVVFLGVIVSGVLVLIADPDFVPGPSDERNIVWSQVASAGAGKFQENWKAGKWPMALAPVRWGENRLCMIGQKMIWTSSDGLQWTASEKTDWGELHGMSFAFFRNRLLMTGGMASWEKFSNDIWFSDDGTNWTRSSTNAPWPPRRGHGLIVFHDRLWLIGGAKSSGRSDQTPSEYYHDVWSSADGIEWKLEADNVPWPGSSEPSVIVFNNTLYLIEMGSRQIWMSGDGKSWKAAGKAPWQERIGGGLAILGENLWLFGGVERNDVWSSSDGIHWEEQAQHAPWTTRTANYSTEFRDRIWIFSGKTGREDSWSGEIWTMSIAK